MFGMWFISSVFDNSKSYVVAWIGSSMCAIASALHWFANDVPESDKKKEREREKKTYRLSMKHKYWLLAIGWI